MGKQKNYILRKLFGATAVQNENDIVQETPKNIDWDEIFLRNRQFELKIIDERQTDQNPTQ